MKPGLSVLVFHLAYDNDEMRTITFQHAGFGAAWRQRDLDYVTNDEFKNLLKQNNVHMVTWGEIQTLMNNP